MDSKTTPGAPRWDPSSRRVVRAAESDVDTTWYVSILGQGALYPVSGVRDQRMRDVYLRQRGCVFRRQLRQVGLSPGGIERRVARGWLTQVHPGVYNTFPDAKIPLAAETAA